MKILHLVATIGLIVASLTGCGDDKQPACFVEGTLVLTPKGPVPIESLKPDDIVIAVDPERKTEVHARVLFNERNLVDAYVQITTGTGVLLGVTHHHPFWSVRTRGFVEIGTYEVGDFVSRWSEGRLHPDKIVGIEWIKARSAVYHLSVDREPHTFVVEDLLVGNKTPPYTDVDIAVKIGPAGAGKVIVDHAEEFVATGLDTLLYLPRGTVIHLEAVPNDGWAFGHWQGDFMFPDSSAGTVELDEDGRLECVFGVTPGL